MEIFIHCWWECKLATTFLGNSLVYLLKLNICIFYDPRVSLLVILLPEMHIYLHLKTHFSSIFYSSKLETTQKSIKNKIGTKIEIYPYNKILCNNENEWTTATSHSDKFHKRNNEWKKPDTKRYILHDPIYIKFKTGKTNMC